MTQEDYNYLKNNLFIFNNVRLTKEQVDMLFEIYSRVDGKTHRPTGCGRCISNAKKRVKIAYDNF
jgi:hypothetical protein